MTTRQQAGHAWRTYTAQCTVVTQTQLTQAQLRALQRVVAVGNGKGGVFKTSTCANMGGLLVREGYRILMIDLDPQGNLADDLGVAKDSDHGAGLVQALVMPGGSLNAVLTGVREGLDVITGGRSLDDLTGMLMSRSLRGSESPNLLLADRLATLLERASPDYDLVLIDTPPGESMLQMLALCAARWLLIPTKADVGSLKGMGTIVGRLIEANNYNPLVDLLGVVLCDVPPAATKLRAETEPKIKQMLEGVEAPMFDSVIRNSVSGYRTRNEGLLAYEMAGKTVTTREVFAALRAGKTPPPSTGTAKNLAYDYARLTGEVLAQISQREQQEVQL